MAPQKRPISQANFLAAGGPQIETFLLKKNSLELKVTLKAKALVNVEVFCCKAANLAFGVAVARLQELLIQAELLHYSGRNLYAYLCTIFDSRGWGIQNLEAEDTSRQAAAGQSHWV